MNGPAHLVPRSAFSLAVRPGALARRAMLDLEPTDGGSVICTRGCALAASFAERAPAPHLEVETWEEVQQLLETHDPDLILVGSDVSTPLGDSPGRDPEGHDGECVRDRTPCLLLHTCEDGVPLRLFHDARGIFDLYYKASTPLPLAPAEIDSLVQRLVRMKRMYRHRGRVPFDPTDDRMGNALIVRCGGLRTRALEYATLIRARATEDPELGAHIDSMPDLDLIVIGGCYCGDVEPVVEGLGRAAELGIPCILPADCEAPFTGFTLPCFESRGLGMMFEYRDSRPWSEIVEAALQERKAWLLAAGLGYGHLPSMGHMRTTRCVRCGYDFYDHAGTRECMSCVHRRTVPPSER